MDLEETLAHQDGVISRAQVLACGGDDLLIARKLRRREWAAIYSGVYVAHTGPLTWRQRAWAAVLGQAPAALVGRSALHAHGWQQPEAGPIEIAVPWTRRIQRRPGIVLTRLRNFSALVQANASPPRVRLEPAVLMLASRARSEDQAVAVVANACQSRRTTPARLFAALDLLRRLPRRALLLEVIADAATGAYSAMERRYLRDVERAHGLPPGARQAREATESGVVFRDVKYRKYGVDVELDGRLGHELAGDRWRDLQRDLDAASVGELTLRAGWRQVLAPCRLAALIGRVLRSRGWTGQLQPCGPDCLAVTDDAAA